MSLFTCGCCGDGFSSTLEEQARHDQDTGYGICPRCEEWIGGRQDAEWRKTQKLVAESLNPANRAKFLGFDEELQRGIVAQMIDEGILTYEVSRR